MRASSALAICFGVSLRAMRVSPLCCVVYLLGSRCSQKDSGGSPILSGLQQHGLLAVGDGLEAGGDVPSLDQDTQLPLAAGLDQLVDPDDALGLSDGEGLLGFALGLELPDDLLSDIDGHAGFSVVLRCVLLQIRGARKGFGQVYLALVGVEVDAAVHVRGLRELVTDGTQATVPKT